MFHRRYSLINSDQSKRIELALSHVTANYRFQNEAAQAHISVIKYERDFLLKALLSYRSSLWLALVAVRKLPLTWLRLHLARKYWHERRDLYERASAAYQDYRAAKKLAPVRRVLEYALSVERTNRSSCARFRSQGSAALQDIEEADQLWDSLPPLLAEMRRLSPKIKPLKVTWNN